MAIRVRNILEHFGPADSQGPWAKIRLGAFGQKKRLAENIVLLDTEDAMLHGRWHDMEATPVEVGKRFWC